jgi:hypothetical protein
MPDQTWLLDWVLTLTYPNLVYGIKGNLYWNLQMCLM